MPAKLLPGLVIVDIPWFPGVIVNVGLPPRKVSALGVTECCNLKSALNVCPTPGLE